MPRVESQDAFAYMKQNGTAAVPPGEYESIELPSNSPNGFVTAFFAVITGFALIWHIWWMAIGALAGAVVTLLMFGWFERVELKISAEQLAQDDRARLSRMSVA
jgi:cytochrome o ubiquinol oxidase subunit 1